MTILVEKSLWVTPPYNANIRYLPCTSISDRISPPVLIHGLYRSHHRLAESLNGRFFARIVDEQVPASTSSSRRVLIRGMPCEATQAGQGTHKASHCTTVEPVMGRNHIHELTWAR